MKAFTKTTTALISGAAVVLMTAAALPSMAQAGQCSDNKTNGVVLGAVAGGALGNSVSGHNRGAGTVIGALLGAAVGHEIGRSTDSCTYDQPRQVVYQPSGYVTRTQTTVYTPAQPAYVERTDWGDRDGGGVYPQFRGREDHIRHEIVGAARDGDISWDDAHRLMGRLGQIQAEERREFGFHGWDLPYDDQDRINSQLDRLDRRVDQMRDNG
jgi:hypothetical protein